MSPHITDPGAFEDISSSNRSLDITKSTNLPDHGCKSAQATCRGVSKFCLPHCKKPYAFKSEAQPALGSRALIGQGKVELWLKVAPMLCCCRNTLKVREVDRLLTSTSHSPMKIRTDERSRVQSSFSSLESCRRGQVCMVMLCTPHADGHRHSLSFAL